VDVLICLAKSAVRQSDALATAAFANSRLHAQVAQMLGPIWREDVCLTRSSMRMHKLTFVTGIVN
jgi:hypothetical protein